MIRNLGYACINMHLQKSKITTNRGMKRATFLAKGLPYASELALKNVIDLEKVIIWNEENDIKFFRISSDIFPWCSEYEFTQLPDYHKIKEVMERIAYYVRLHKHRLSAHPGPFNLLASPNEAVVKKTLIELENHSKVFDLLELEESVYNKINIHIGATYNNKELAANTWVKNVRRLSDTCLSRLTVENDDKASMWSVKELYEMVHSQCSVPIVFDYHHHSFCTGGLSEFEALQTATKTWPYDIIPVVHYSEGKSVHLNDSTIRPQAHSELINGPIKTYGINVDVMIECKGKEQGLLNFRKSILLKD